MSSTIYAYFKTRRRARATSCNSLFQDKRSLFPKLHACNIRMMGNKTQNTWATQADLAVQVERPVAALFEMPGTRRFEPGIPSGEAPVVDALSPSPE